MEVGRTLFRGGAKDGTAGRGCQGLTGSACDARLVTLYIVAMRRALVRFWLLGFVFVGLACKEPAPPEVPTTDGKSDAGEQPPADPELVLRLDPVGEPAPAQ